MAGIKFGGFCDERHPEGFKFRSCDNDATVILIVTFLAIVSGFWAQQSAYIVALAGPFLVLYLRIFVLFQGYSHCKCCKSHRTSCQPMFPGERLPRPLVHQFSLLR